jgi:hypothetical protein
MIFMIRISTMIDFKRCLETEESYGVCYSTRCFLFWCKVLTNLISRDDIRAKMPVVLRPAEFYNALSHNCTEITLLWWIG